MAVCIRLARCGARSKPFYRVVAADDRKPVTGKFIEVIGTYDSRKKEGKITLNKERFDHWIKNGARLSRTISELVTS